MDVIMQRSGREGERRQGHAHARGVPSGTGVPSAAFAPSATGVSSATNVPFAKGWKAGRVGSAWVATMLMAAGVCLATDYVWTGGGSDDHYNNTANWSPNTGWPNCCTHTATIGYIATGQDTHVDILAGLSAKAVQQITVNSDVDEEYQTVWFHDGDDSDPKLKCEVFVIDATSLSHALTVKITDGAKIETMTSCVCTP